MKKLSCVSVASCDRLMMSRENVANVAPLFV